MFHTQTFAEIAFHLICAAVGLAMLGLAADRWRLPGVSKYRRIPIAAGLVVMGRIVGLLALALGAQALHGFHEWVLETLALAAFFWAFLYAESDSPKWATAFLVVTSLLLTGFFVAYLMTRGPVPSRTWSVILWLTTLILNSFVAVHLLRHRHHSSHWLRGAFLFSALAAAIGLLDSPSTAALVHSAALALFALEIAEVAPVIRGGYRRAIQEAEERSLSLIERAAFLLEVGRAVSSSLSLPVVLERVSEATAHAIAADWAYVLLPEEENAERLLVAARYGWWGRRWKKEIQPRRQITVNLHDFSLLRHSFIRQRQVLANQPEDYEQLVQIHDRLSRPPAGPILIQPLHVRERSLGSLLLGRVETAPRKNGHGTQGFGESDAELCRVLASQAAAAIDNAQMYQDVRQEAATLADRLEWSNGQLSQYRATLETFEDGILILSPARELIAINQAAKTLLGVPDEPTLSEAIESLSEQLIDAVGWRAGDPAHVRWNGRELVGISTPLKTPEGEFLGRAVVLRDITQEQQIEMAVQRQVDRISRRVEASVASITGYASLLALGSDGSLDRNRQSLAALQTSSESIVGLVDDLLLVTETLWGTVRLVPELVDTRRVLEAAVAAASSNAEEKHQKLILNLSPDLCLVRGDPHRLKQIVGKLLASAVYYTPEGECIMIEGSSVLLRDDQGLLCKHLVVRIHDCGPGAPPEGAIEDLDAFHRVKNLSSPEAGGTGLGLIGAKKLVEAHGGSIWAEGAADGGCILNFTIPAGEAAEAPGSR